MSLDGIDEGLFKSSTTNRKYGRMVDSIKQTVQELLQKFKVIFESRCRHNFYVRTRPYRIALQNSIYISMLRSYPS